MNQSQAILVKIRSLAGIAILLTGVLSSIGCSYLSPAAWRDTKPMTAAADELILRITLDKPVYRPNEALIMEVTVTNTTEETIKIAQLDSVSASFWFGFAGEDRRMERHPVVSSVEEADLKRRGSELLDLKPGRSHSRKFVHTRMTRDPGKYTAQAHMLPFVDFSGARAGKLYSNFSEFEVAGDPVCERDNAGLMMQADAVKLAREKVEAAQGPVFATDSILARDEATGFYAWWVNLDYRLPDGAAYRTSYLVDPYRAVIKDKAQPFPDSMKPPEPGSVRPPKPPLGGGADGDAPPEGN